MTEQISDERLRELTTFSESEEDDEMVAIYTELAERRRQAGYNRQQRLDFLLRVVRDAFPEIARDLRQLYVDQDSNLYYLRRHLEDCHRRRDELAEEDDRQTLPPEAQ